MAIGRRRPYRLDDDQAFGIDDVENRKLAARQSQFAAEDFDQPLPLVVAVTDDHAPVIIFAGMRAIGIVGCHCRPAVIVDKRRTGPMRPIAGRIAGSVLRQRGGKGAIRKSGSTPCTRTDPEQGNEN